MSATNVIIKPYLLQGNNTYRVGSGETHGLFITGCKSHKMKLDETEWIQGYNAFTIQVYHVINMINMKNYIKGTSCQMVALIIIVIAT